MKKRRKFFWITLSLGFVVLAGFAVSQFTYGMALFDNKKFYKGTTINGTDVSGLTVEEVSNLVSAKLMSSRGDVKIRLTYKDKVWEWTGEDFEPNNSVLPAVQEVFANGRSGNVFARRSSIKKIRTEGLNIQIPYTYILGGIDEKIDEVAEEIDVEPLDARVDFNPSAQEVFTFVPEKVGVKLEKTQLKNRINLALAVSKEVNLEVPVTESEPTVTAAELKQDIGKRGEFSTSIATSKADRKHNVKHALEAFNGMIVQPDEEVSFNNITGSRTTANGYKKANVILNGVYVEGAGGGVCQASTTLYNALILSDLEILEVNPHSLPASYVPLAFDAMVSEGYSDLVFKNNTDKPIYIKTSSDDKKVYVEIYGKPFEEGLKIVRKADFVEVLKHPGDRIVKDVDGTYSDKVTFEGEYYRLKYPQEGYHSRALLQYYKNDELLEEKLIRDEIYKPQEGIIIEGTEKLGEGMTLPENTVKFIPPQTTTQTTKDGVEKKIEKQNPTSTAP